jgi:hypothetical protein
MPRSAGAVYHRAFFEEEVPMLSAAFFALMLSAASPELVVPEGTVLPITLNETVNTAKVQDNDPILFTLADDARAGGRRGPILIPRGSDVVGRIVKAKQAGHFIGRSDLDIRIQEIITPTGEVFDGLTTKIVNVSKTKGEKGDVNRNGVIEGPVHRERDAFFLLFPPTTLFQLIATPKRGPNVVLPVETRLYVKLMNPIYAESRVTSATPVAPAAPIFVPQAAAPQIVPQFVPQALPRLSSNSLDILVTPIALYPDAILQNVFAASAHPLEIIQASQWIQAGRGYDTSWSPSVLTVATVPDLLQRLSHNIEWTTNLGAAYASQPADVMNAVARMRGQVNTFRSSTTAPVLALRP